MPLLHIRAPRGSGATPTLLKGVLALLGALAISMPVQAQDVPEITPSLKKLLGGLPIRGIKNEVQGMVGALKKTSCGAQLTGCYMTQSGPLQLYFFTSGAAQQTLLLVVDKSMVMPHLLGEKAQKVLGETSLMSPIISLSTTDYELDNIKMPPALQQVVRDKYFNVNTLSFSSGVQLAARANLGGLLKMSMQSMGADTNALMMRAAVVMPIPADLAGGAGAGVGLADAVAHGETMKKAGADAAKPEAFVEFSFSPKSSLQLSMPKVVLTDATFFLNNALTFGYKGNAAFPGAETKKVIMHFQTPLNPAGAMDLLDFEFRMATPASFTMEDAAHMMVGMATPDGRLAKYGGGFIRNIDMFKGPLLAMTKPLSVVQLRNPQPPPPYAFGDSTKPFPDDNKYFNFSLLGPLATDGPLLKAAGDVKILGQKMGWLYATAGRSGLNGDVGEAITVKLGPLGKVSFKMQATMAISGSQQNINLLGNFAGQKVEVGMSGSTMKVAVSASCVNPFEIKTQLEIQPTTDIAEVFEGQGGVNVDPSKIGGCIGKELEAAYNKIAGEYKNLSGYTASAANAELTKIADAAAKAAEAEYNRVKAQTRQAAESSINAVSKTFSGATNTAIGAAGGKTAKSSIDVKTMLYDRSVFDWDYFYDAQPGLVAAKTDLVAYWKSTGYKNRMRGSFEFDIPSYQTKNPSAVKDMGGSTDADSMTIHWLVYGIKQGLQSSPDFHVKAYLDRYPDLQNAFGQDNYAAALVHWIENGKREGRDGGPNKTVPLCNSIKAYGKTLKSSGC
ncbi:lectin [Hydrogenophaga sp.]|uniref:lectin n=1 Tax=Hydrogenophaga sp. TaxID=1904254 RepID=UPI00356A0F3B